MRLPFSLNLGDLVKIWKQYSGLSVAKAEAVVPRKEMGSKKIIQLLKRNGCDTAFHFDADCKQRRKKKKSPSQTVSDDLSLFMFCVMKTFDDFYICTV